MPGQGNFVLFFPILSCLGAPLAAGDWGMRTSFAPVWAWFLLIPLFILSMLSLIKILFRQPREAQLLRKAEERLRNSNEKHGACVGPSQESRPFQVGLLGYDVPRVTRAIEFDPWLSRSVTQRIASSVKCGTTSTAHVSAEQRSTLTSFEQ